jgi:hypothetical protein
VNNYKDYSSKLKKKELIGLLGVEGSWGFEFRASCFHVCKVGALPLEPHFQFIFCSGYFRDEVS